MKKCRSWRLKWFGPVRCTWRAGHNAYTKVHCNEDKRVYWQVRKSPKRWR